MPQTNHGIDRSFSVLVVSPSFHNHVYGVFENVFAKMSRSVESINKMIQRAQAIMEQEFLLRFSVPSTTLKSKISHHPRGRCRSFLVYVREIVQSMFSWNDLVQNRIHRKIVGRFSECVCSAFSNIKEKTIIACYRISRKYESFWARALNILFVRLCVKRAH